MNKRSSNRILISAVGILVAGAGAWADGLRNPPDGAFSVGRFGGKIAQVDDASALTINPANLADLEKPTYAASVTLAYGKKEFEDVTGAKAESEQPWALLPALYAIWPVKDDGWVAGVGLNSPFGRSTIYDDHSILRYTAPYFAQIRSANLNPTLARKLSDQWSVAVGADVLYSDFNLKQYYPWAMVTMNPAAPDGKTIFDADGIGLGANAAVTWKPAAGHRVAVTYRSPIKVDYEGDLTVSKIPGGLPPPLAGVSPRSDFETEIEFPAVVGLGYGWAVTKDIRVEADVEWIQHSTFDQLELQAGNNEALLPSTTLEADWDDTWTVGLGADWDFAENWTARAGYFYVPTPEPSRTLTPSIAEEDQSVVSAGLGYHRGDRRVDMAYAYGVFDGREVSDNVNPAYNGNYDFEAHLITLTYGASF